MKSSSFSVKKSGVTLPELIIILAVIGITLLLLFPKFKTLDSDKKEILLKDNITLMRATVMDYYAKQVEKGMVPSFPTMNASLFLSNSIPEEPFSKSSKVITTTTIPTPKSLYTLDGGWIYNKLTGEIQPNVEGYTDL